MIDMNLTVNNQSFTLGIVLSDERIQVAKFKKHGFFQRRHLKGDYEDILWAKNPMISCFNGSFVLTPFNYLNKTLKAIRRIDPLTSYATLAYLLFNDQKAEHLIFQLVLNEFVARYYAYEFNKLCTEKYGKSTKSGPTHIWYDSETLLLSQNTPGTQSAVFHLIKRGKPRKGGRIDTAMIEYILSHR